MANAIAWPRGPYRTRVAYRVATAVMAFCGLFVILMMAGIVGFVANERTTRQTAADAAAAFGFGAPIANARVEDVSCSPRYRSSTSAAILFHRCDVRIAGPAGRLADMQIDLHRPVTIAEAGAVHRVGMQWAVVWPRPLGSVNKLQRRFEI